MKSASPDLLARLLHGQVIVAHPLALDTQRGWDPCHQQVLTRYYHAAGAGGLAVGVHTTQFEIHDPTVGLLEPVLDLTARTVQALDSRTGRHTLLITGICGPTRQAVREAARARELGYHAGLLSLGAFSQAPNEVLLEHAHAVAREIPLFGFYLQPAAGGRLLDLDFWRQFVCIPNLVAIKIAPFNRYQTLDVLRAVAESGRAHDIALYTGNDDHIVLDLVTDWIVPSSAQPLCLRMAGGLLGHWACWTEHAVALFESIQTHRADPDDSIPGNLLRLASEITDANAALFDAANRFSGCLSGIQSVLHRQKLLASPHCLDPNQGLSPGQQEELDRIAAWYPHLTDDTFIEQHRDDWLRASR